MGWDPLDDNAPAALEKTDFDILTQVDLSGLQRLADKAVDEMLAGQDRLSVPR